jgi:hypothetical protein
MKKRNLQAARRFLAIGLLLALLSFGGSGCLAALAGGAAAGGAGYAYYRGNVPESYDADLATVWQATHDALFDLGLPVVTESKDAMNGTIESANGKNEKVTIVLEQQVAKIPTDPPKTKVGIRVATFGDQDMSRRMHQQITMRLASARGIAHTPAVPANQANQPAAWKPSTPAVK